MAAVLEGLFSGWPVSSVAGVATVFHRGGLRMSSQHFHEAGWRELVRAGLLRSAFVPWAREQYTVMITKKGEAAIMSDLTLAVSAAAQYHLYDTSAFLIGGMVLTDLPEFLSHEVVTIREAAAARLEKLTDGSCEEK